METFTIEEINLLCIYNTDTRQSLLRDLQVTLPDIYEPEMREIVQGAIHKLTAMDEETYLNAASTLIPTEEYFGEEED